MKELTEKDIKDLIHACKHMDCIYDTEKLSNEYDAVGLKLVHIEYCDRQKDKYKSLESKLEKLLECTTPKY